MKYNDSETKNLFAAFNSNDIPGIRQALERGADPNAQTKKGVTPLMLAIRMSPNVMPWKATIDLLITHGADINFVNKKGTTVLAAAARMSFIEEEIVIHLLSHGADVHQKIQAKKDGTQCELSILDMAITNSVDDRIVSLLRQYGAQKLSVSDTEEEDVHKFHDRLNSSFASAGIEIPEIEKKKQLSFTESKKLLHISFYEQNNYKAVIDALNQGADPCMKDENGKHIQNRNGKTLLHITAAQGKLPFVKRLLEDGCEVDAIDETGMTPLMESLSYPYITEHLVKNGADVNHTDNANQTPLFYARDYECADILIKNGADIHHTNDDEKTALEYVLEWNSPEVSYLLFKNGARLGRYQHFLLNDALNYDLFLNVMQLIEYGVDLFQKDIRGHNAYERAVLNHSTASVYLLEKHDADPGDRISFISSNSEDYLPVKSPVVQWLIKILSLTGAVIIGFIAIPMFPGFPDL